MSSFQNLFSFLKLFSDVNYGEVIANAYADNKADPFTITANSVAAAGIKSVYAQEIQKIAMCREIINKSNAKVQEGLKLQQQQARQHEAGKFAAKMMYMIRRAYCIDILEEDGNKADFGAAMEWLSHVLQEEVMFCTVLQFLIIWLG